MAECELLEKRRLGKLARARGTRVLLVAAVCLAAGAGTGYAMWQFSDDDARTEALGTPSTCLTEANVLLAPAVYGDFVELVDQLMENPPFFGIAPTHAFQTTFVEGRLRGSITRKAYDSPYKEANDELKRSLNYDIGPTLLVPLQGRIVRDHPGLLEVYQVHYSFAETEGAAAWMRSVRQSTEGEGLTHLSSPSKLGDDMVVWKRQAIDDEHETYIGVTVRLGSSTVSFTFQGGRDVTLATVLPYVEMGLASVRQACQFS